MRIVHVVPSLPTQIQGDQRHVLCLAGMQRARGLNAVVVTNSSGLFSDWCEQDGTCVFVADDMPMKGQDVSPASIFATKVRDLNADIIHCHYIGAARAALSAANRLNVPCVITMHSGMNSGTIREFTEIKRSGEEFTVIAVSKKEYEMHEGSMAGLDYHYVPNGSMVRPVEDRREQGRSRNSNLIMVGALQSRKGIDVAILAMLKLRARRGPDCPVLNIYGAGPQGGYYVEMTRLLQLDDLVKFHGIQLDILGNCPSSDILIMASRQETGPLVVLEAMSRGMPIVATNVGEVCEILPDQQYGRVVSAESITELADAIESTLADIASDRFDPHLLIERHRSQYSIDKMAERIEDVYRSAMLGCRSSGRIMSAKS